MSNLKNILINKDMHVVVGDWGLSRFMETHDVVCFTSEVQTLWYRCPELLLGQRAYNIAIDMWSIGVMMYELNSGNPLFMGDSCIGQLMAIFHELGTPNETIWPGVSSLPDYKSESFPKWSGECKKINSLCISVNGRDLLLKMLKMDPSQRINYIDALNHDYFSSIRTTTIVHIPLKKKLLAINETQINHMYLNTIQSDITDAMRNHYN